MSQVTNNMRIAVNGLAKRFNREWIFRNFDETFESGKRYAVTGPNGSGKSTLLQVLWGQSPPSKGTISYQRNGLEVLPADVFNHLSIAAPYMDLIDDFTLDEQIRFHFQMKKIRQPFTAGDIAEKINLTTSLHKQIGNFSSGMRQRVKLALAFFTESDIIFLDEPGTNLDTRSFDWYLENLAAIPPATMVFIASNNEMEYPNADAVIDILKFK